MIKLFTQELINKSAKEAEGEEVDMKEIKSFNIEKELLLVEEHLHLIENTG
jgi:hypothetical protein